MVYRQKLLALADAQSHEGPDALEDAPLDGDCRLEDALVALVAAISSLRAQVGDAAARDLVITVYDLTVDETETEQAALPARRRRATIRQFTRRASPSAAAT